MRTDVRIRRLPHFEGLELPAYQTEGAAGMDVRAAVAEDAPVTLLPGDRAMIPTGLAMAVPPGFECQVRPRSGLAAKHGLTCLNSPGTIDSDYRGEVQVVLVNHGTEPVAIAAGDRVAQLLVQQVCRVSFVAGDLDDTARGVGGFGSTGQ